MKFNISKEWCEQSAKIEGDSEVGAGVPPTPREMWLAEVRRLLVTKYAITWPAEEVAAYAESLAESFYDDADWRDTPDNAIDEDFRAGL
jgi:hypothetical protein